MLHHPRFKVPVTLAALFVAGAAAFSGCTWWHNFSTYYNTVYLAQTHLDAYEASQRAVVAPNASATVAVKEHRWLEEEYLMRQEGIRTGHVEPITPSFSQSLSATKQVTNVHLDSAIILGSKILADKKGTKYREDALFIVGKAQFYKNDFIGAERKFRELLANYPQTKYGAQVEVFLARSMLVNHDIDTAAIQLQHGLQATKDSKDVVTASSIHRAMAELIYAKNPDSLGTIASELHAAEAGLTGEDLARLAYQEGAVEFLNGDWPSAETAFQTTAKSADDDWLAGEAHVAKGLTLREEGNLDAAKAEFASVIAHVKYSASAVAARYELAYTNELIARKAVGDDLQSTVWHDSYEHPVLSEYHILDTTYRTTSALITSRSRFRQSEIFREMGRYDTAAQTASGLINTKDFSSPAMSVYVSDRASSLADYAHWQKELGHLDTLITTLTPKAGARGHSDVKVQGETGEDNIHVKAMQEVLGPRWRPEQPPQMTRVDSNRVKEAEMRLRQKAPIRLAVKDTAHFLDSIQFRAGMAHYQIGRSYETFGEISEARDEYRTADTMNIGTMDTGRIALRARTLYAWLELEKQQKNQPVADSLLHELLSNYGQTMYAEQARILYVTSSRNSPGELAYLSAYTILRDSGVNAAKPPLLNIVTTFSQEDVAPRSLFAIGETYEESARYDSALAYYHRVMTEYPYSSYAFALRPRLADAGSPGRSLIPSRTFTPAPIPQETTQPSDDASQTIPQPPLGIQKQPPNPNGNTPPRPWVQPPMPPLPPGTVPPPHSPGSPGNMPPPPNGAPDTTHP
jgi:tetratricopeptide (TPR) repeat protein